LWIVTVVWAGLIFYLSTGTFGGSFSAWLLHQILGVLHIHVSPHTFGILHHLFRKTAHTTEYAIFAMLLYSAQVGPGQIRWQPGRAVLCIVVAALYSFTDEFHQRFVPGRGPSPIDCAIDTMGATLGMLLVYLAASNSRGPEPKLPAE
jgi:VanZ family protein